jgi:hypothetical protein
MTVKKKSKFNLGGIQDGTEFGKCLLRFSSEPFVFSSAIGERKN